MSRVYQCLLLLLLSLVAATVSAQKKGQARLDSLRGVLPLLAEDSTKVRVLNSLSFAYNSINPTEGIKFGKLAIDLAAKLNMIQELGRAYNCMGVNYDSKSDYVNALIYYEKALKIFEDHKYKNSIASVTGNIAVIYQYQGNNPKALEYYFKSLKVHEEQNDKNGIAKVTQNIGLIYYDLNDYSKALEYYNKALALDKKINNQYDVGMITGNIGSINLVQKDYAKALENFSNSLKIREEISDSDGMANAIGNIGSVYQELKDYQMALDYYTRSIEIFEVIGNRNGLATQLLRVGMAYLSLACDSSVRSVAEVRPQASLPQGKHVRLAKAIDYLNRSLVIAKEISAPNILEGCYMGLATVYQVLGDYKRALECTNNYNAIRDTVFSKENSEKVLRIGLESEFQRQRFADSLSVLQLQKAQLLKLQRQRALTWSGIAGIVLLLFFSFFILKERSKSEKLLLNILPAEVAKELKSTGSSNAKYFEDVTVLFTDFVDFTRAGEQMNPQELVNELDICFKAFDAIVARYKIEKIKTIGDAYLAVAGLPVADPQHAASIVSAAIDINAFMQDRRSRLGNKTFNVRIGIHSGSVVAGIVGIKKFAYDIWGDTVNTAARMEQNSEPGKINISETTYDLVKEKFKCDYRGEIDAKNKGAMKMYFIAATS